MSKPLAQPVARIAAKFKQLRSVDNEPGEEYDESVETVVKRAQSIGYAPITSKPRRGCILEYKALLDYVVPALLKVPRSKVVPARANRINFSAGEMWREAECFLHRPYSFSRLKALPELRQIISHTCLDVIHAAAGRMTHITAGADTPTQHQQQQQQEDEQGSAMQRPLQRLQKSKAQSKSKSKQRSWDALDDLDLDFDLDLDLDLHEDGLGLDSKGSAEDGCVQPQAKALRTLLQADESPLMLHLAPGLRLCLAAEVAVGLLCPGQDAPPDTPEHAAALQMFVTEAFAHAEAETLGDTSRNGQLPVNTPACVGELLASLVPSKQHPDRRYFAASTMHQSPLAPHLDLQLQLPPQQLLQLLVEAASAATQQQQHGQQQREAGQGLLPSILGDRHPACQQQLEQLVAPWQEAAAAVHEAQEDSSSCNALVAALLLDCTALLEQAGKQQQQQQQQQCTRQGEEFGGAAAAAAAASSTGQADTTSSSGSSSSCISCGEGQAGAGAAAAADMLLHRTSTLASALLLQFVKEALPPDGEAASAAWQQAVPLQVLLLCSRVQQLQGALQRCIASLQQGAQPQQQQQQGDGQQQQQGQQGELQQQTPEQTQQDVAAHRQPETCLAALMEHVVGLLQCIRRFKDANEARTSTAACPNGTAAVRCAANAASSSAQRYRGSSSSWSSANNSSSSSSGSSSAAVQPLSPALFFSAGGPLAGGLWSFSEPAGAGIWAPPDAAAAAAAGGVEAAEQQQQQQSRQGSDPAARHAGPCLQGQAGSSCSPHSGMAQQAWQVLLGSCAWQQALQEADNVVAAHLQPSDEELHQQLQTQLLYFTRRASAADKLAMEANVEQIKELSNEAPADMAAALRACAVTHVLGRMVEAMREAALERQGFDACKWTRRQQLQLQRRKRRLALASRLERAGFGSRCRGGMWSFTRAEIEHAQRRGVLAPHETLETLDTWEEEDELDIMQREKLGMMQREAAVDTMQREQLDFKQREDALGIMQQKGALDSKQREQPAVLSSEALKLKAVAQVARHTVDAIDEELRQITALFSDDDDDEQEALGLWEESDRLHPPAQLANGHATVAAGSNSSSSQRLGNTWGSGSSSSSDASPHAVNGGSNGVVSAGGDAADALPARLPQVAAVAAAAGGAGSTWVLPAEVDKAEQVLREFAAQCSSLFAPLLTWYAAWAERKAALYRQSETWWESTERRSAAVEGARGRKLPPTSGPAASQALPPMAAPAASQKASSSSGTSSSREWPSGGYNFCVNCPLCLQDQQQQQQQQQPAEQHAGRGDCNASRLGSGCSDGSAVCGGDHASSEVPYCDPFMWRRLLWQLLGKLSPEAQAFYAQYLGVCPHCPDHIVWGQIRRSLLVCMWSSPAADAVEQQLAFPTPMSIQEGAKRSDRVLQYARTLNSNYMKHHHHTGPLLAQQLLVALSPLHGQLLPRPETAFLCPCSFPAAVGKALSGQLLARPLLDSCQHDSAHLSMWHVWWHVGLRRYAAQQKQQQRQQQQQVVGVGGRTRASVGSWPSMLSAAELDALYTDPDAKVYAVHFATRQLSGTNGHACSMGNSSSNSSSSIGQLGMSPAAAAAADAAMQALLDFADAARRRALATPPKDDPRRQRDGLPPVPADAAAPTPNGNGRISSSNVAAGAGNAAEGGRAEAEACCFSSSMCAHLAQSDGQLLLRALQCPAGELLAPAAQRRLAANQDATAVKVGVEAVQQYLSQFVLLNGETNGKAHTLQFADAIERVRRWREQQPLHCMQPQSDIQALALQPPVPIEALVHQEVVVRYHEFVLMRSSSCDACGHCLEGDDEETCATCGEMRYCCPECMGNHAEEHAAMCSQLQAGKLRYSARNRLKPGSGPGSGLPQAFGRLLQPVLQPPPEPLAFSTDACALLSCGCLETEALGPALLPMDLFLAEAGRLYGQGLQAQPTLSAMDRVVMPWRRCMP